ncbi:hypothetical protein [Acinetobacter towneri]|uniref:hypothetical protein n=1 Tax=Acinetobacter towneri TaxID=202956 RepID=UPI003A85B82F
MQNNIDKEIVKNIGEAVIDTALTAANAMTFGISANVSDLIDKFHQRCKSIKRQHAVKQISVFYETPSRVNGNALEKFKTKHDDHEEIILDLIKTLDLTIDKKQSKMLAKLLESYVLGEINHERYIYWKYIIVKLDAFLLNNIDALYKIKDTKFNSLNILPEFWNFNFIEEIPSNNFIRNGSEHLLPNYRVTQNFKDFYKILCID